MRNKPHFTLLGMLLLSALAFSMVLSAAPAFASSSFSTRTNRQIAQHQQLQDPSGTYGDGYRVGYQQGFQDGKTSCAPSPSGKSHPRALDPYDQGYADGYNFGFQYGCSYSQNQNYGHDHD
jgi:hypothetical protein